MFYRGYVIKYVEEKTLLGKPQRTLVIFDKDKRLAAVSSDDEFAKHVVDVKIKEGRWPDKESSKLYSPEKEIPQKRKRGRPRKL